MIAAPTATTTGRRPEPGSTLVTRPTWVPVWLGLVGLLALVVVGRFWPNGQLFYPQCFLFVTTGWQCPGCGVTRATHALLHGDLLGAWRLNPLWVLLLPMLTWTYVAWVVNDLGRRRWFQPLAHPYVIAALLGLVAGFGVVRNLSWSAWLGN